MLDRTDTKVISTFQANKIRALFVETAKYNFVLIYLQGREL